MWMLFEEKEAYFFVLFGAEAYFHEGTRIVKSFSFASIVVFGERYHGIECWEWGRPPVRKRSHKNLFWRKNLRI